MDNISVVFGMTRLGIKPTTSQSESRCPTARPLSWFLEQIEFYWSHAGMPPSFPQPVYAYHLFDGNQEDTAKSLHKTGRQLHLSTPPPRQGDFPAEVGAAPGFFSLARRGAARRFPSLLAREGSVVFLFRLSKMLWVSSLTCLWMWLSTLHIKVGWVIKSKCFLWALYQTVWGNILWIESPG